MTTPARPAGKRGRLPAKAAAERYAIRFIHEYTGPLPAPAYPVDVSAGITAWGMLGNNKVGDCTFAGREHNRMAKAGHYGETETWETADALVAEYFAYTGGQDTGANIADLLLYWYRNGKILAFAPVDHNDPAAMDSAMAQFRGLYTGVNLTDDADLLFSEGKPWSVASGQQPDPSEGHCIVKVFADGGGLDGWVTWGAVQKSTMAWSRACVEEAWAIITSEDEVDPAALAALRADIEALGGQGGQPPAPPADADAALWAEAGPWCAVTRTRPDLVALKASLQAWAAAKNLS